MDIVAAEGGPYLFIAEGVLAYLEEEQVRGLVLALKERFPGSDFVFDAPAALLTRISGLHPLLRNSQARVRWGLGDSRAIERWGDGLRLLADWRYYEQGEPRLGPYNVLRWVPVLRDFRILRYRLGGPPAGDSPYAAHQIRLLREFDQAVRRVKELLVARLGAETTAAMVEESRAEYAALIPQMPYIGGKQPFTQFVVFTAWFLAMYRVLKRRGYSVEEIGRLISEMGQAFVGAYPAYLLRLMGRRYFSRRHIAEVQRRAAASPHSPYPDDYLYDFVEGDGIVFDWGVDYRRCAGVEFLKAQGALELAPYLCAGDVLYSDAFGWGLARTTTLAEGHERCDFRFKKGAPTRVVLPPALQEFGAPDKTSVGGAA
jgi:hypothetical protein